LETLFDGAALALLLQLLLHAVDSDVGDLLGLWAVASSSVNSLPSAPAFG